MTLSFFFFFLAFPSPGKGPRPTENGSATNFWVLTHQLRTTALDHSWDHAERRFGLFFHPSLSKPSFIIHHLLQFLN